MDDLNLLDDGETITIRLPKEIIELLATYAQKKGKKVDGFVIGIVTKSVEELQYADQFWEKFRLWASPRLIEVIPTANYVVHVKFDDGVSGEYPMMPAIQRGGEFADLFDLARFRQVRIGEDGKSISWPGNVAVSSETVYAGLMFDEDDGWNE